MDTIRKDNIYNLIAENEYVEIFDGEELVYSGIIQNPLVLKEILESLGHTVSLDGIDDVQLKEIVEEREINNQTN